MRQAERDRDHTAAELRALHTLRKQFGLRECGAGKFDAYCPVHDDRGSRSLRVYRDGLGKLRFRCYAGCDYNAIRASLGLQAFKSGRVAQRAAQPQTRAERESRKANYNYAQLADYFRCTRGELAPLARHLGVSIDSLVDAGVGRANAYPMLVRGRFGDYEKRVTAWVWPMYDERMEVCGLRMRPDEGDKYSFTGSRPGVFAGTGWQAADRRVVCTEGATDRAAFYDWGYNVLGKPSCTVGDDIIVAILRGVWLADDRRRRLEVVVASQVDEAKYRNDGSVFYPGQESAARLADLLCTAARDCVATVRVITPPAGIKDYRDWIRRGGTRRSIEQAIAGREYYRPMPGKEVRRAGRN